MLLHGRELSYIAGAILVVALVLLAVALAGVVMLIVGIVLRSGKRKESGIKRTGGGCLISLGTTLVVLVGLIVVGIVLLGRWIGSQPPATRPTTAPTTAPALEAMD